MQEEHICPKCAGMLKEGTLSGNQVDWQSDTKQSFLQSSGKKIVTYACEKCGYLESYVRL